MYVYSVNPCLFIRLISCLQPPPATVHVSYEGKYQTATITEFVVQDATGKGFIKGIRKEIQSQLSCIQRKVRIRIQHNKLYDVIIRVIKNNIMIWMHLIWK